MQSTTAEPEIFSPAAGDRALGVVIGGTRYIDPSTRTTHHTLDVLDLDRNALERIGLDFLAHGFTTHPEKRHIAAVFEKHGPGAALVDLAESKLLGHIRTSTRREFYGHGVWSPDGQVVYSVETVLDTHAGVVVVRDSTTFKDLEKFPTYGQDPHDCFFVDSGKTLVMTNGGGDVSSAHTPCVTYVDVASRKLVDKVTFGDPNINAGHAVVARDGSLVVCSAPRDGLPPETSTGGVTIRIGREKAQRMRKPEGVVAKMLGESLSVCLHEPSGIAAVTNPIGHIVTFWSIRTQKLVHTFEIESPRGVTLTLDGRYFVLAHGTQSRLTLLSTRTLEPVASAPELSDRVFSGSHIYTWKSD